MAITRKVEVTASADLRGEAIRPHSFQAQFQAAADELASSSGGPAGSSVPGRSEEPAPIAVSVLDRSRSRSRRDLDTPQAAGTGCEPPIIRRIPISGANSADIEHCDQMLELLGNLFLSAIKGHTDNIRENVPITHVESFHDLEQEFRDWLHVYRQRVRAMDRD